MWLLTVPDDHLVTVCAWKLKLQGTGCERAINDSPARSCPDPKQQTKK